MESLCDRALRCLCSCLIKKEAVSYTQANDEQNKFITLNDHVEQQTRQSQKIESTENELSGKLKQYLEQASSKQNKQEKLAQPKVALDLNHQVLQDDQEKLLKLQQAIVKDYSDVMSVNHPYYELFKEKLARLHLIFDLPEDNNLSQPYTDYGLKLHCYPSGKYNVFVYSFKLPTDFETYDSILDNFSLQKTFDPNIDEYKKELQIVGQNTKVLYLAYKKVLIISSRDFYYVKYSFSKYNENWSICISDLSYAQVKNKVRGEMLLTATRIVEVDGHIQVSVYSLIDMKMNIKLQLAKNRGYGEIKKYLDKVYTYLSQQKNKKQFDI